jgi:nitrous oxidase accessory protein NosD
MPKFRLKSQSKKLLPIGIIIIIIVLAVGIYGVSSLLSGSKPTSTIGVTSTVPYTTTPTTNMEEFTGCGQINAPGTYYLTKNVKYTKLSGTCISISSSNVILNCNNNKLIGSGPYTGVSPYSYGVYASNGVNVSVLNCQIMNFSYGTYLSSINGGTLYLDNMSFNPVSNLVLNNSKNLSILQSYFSKAASNQGSIYITQNSTSNFFANNTVRFNAVYGINVNSTGNRFNRNLLSSTPSSFYCSATAGFPSSNKGTLNTCYNNTGCGFVQCNGFNQPPNIPSLQLSHGKIQMCGSINAPGIYQLSGNLNMGSFLNTTNPLVQQELIPCINIRSGNVHLSCNGFTISDAPIGINVSNAANVTILNCNINGSTYGINFVNVNDSTVTKLKISNSSFGIKLVQSHTDGIINSSSQHNIYGVYLSGSNSTQISNFNVSHNYYGIYVNNSFGNYFNGGAAFNNSNADIYATPDDVNKSLELTTGVACGTTDAFWIKCNKLISPTLLYYPMQSCGPITQSGNYLLTTGILAPGQQCITITASHVVFDCGGDSIIPLTYALGPAISVIGGTNVTVMNCAINRFGDAVFAANTTSLSVSGISSTNTNFGVQLNDVKNSVIRNNRLLVTSNSSISLSNSTGISIMNNTLSGGPQNIGINLLHSRSNRILNNTEASGYAGLFLSANSTLNTVSNNTASLNSEADFVCNGNSGAFNAQNGTVNYGSSKIGCTWLAAIPSTIQGISCQDMTNPTTYTLSTDAVYPYGSTCLSATSGQVMINCEGHTVYATHGGTFAWFTTGKDNMLENCYLKGFSQPVISSGAQLSLINDTIISTDSTHPAVNITNGTYSNFIDDNISSMQTGLSIRNSTYGTIRNVNINAPTAYLLYNISGFTIQNAYSTGTSGVGMLFSNSTLNYFSNSNFSGVFAGIVCTGTAQSKGGASDEGGISCHSNQNCAWISASSATCK